MRILAISDLRGATEYLPLVTEVAEREHVGAVVFSGNIIDEDERIRAYEESTQVEPGLLDELEQRAVEAYEAFFDEMGGLDIPVFVVPGRLDAPKRLYYQAAMNHEIVAPNIYMVHRSFALPLQGWNLVVAGFGGGLSDDPRGWEHDLAQVYPAWLPEFALDYVRHFEQETMLLFHTPPKHGGLDRHNGQHIGHPMIDHVIKTYHPRFAFVGAARDGQGSATIAATLVVNPGWLKDGKYAILDTRTEQVAFGQLSLAQPAEPVLA